MRSNIQYTKYYCEQSERVAIINTGTYSKSLLDIQNMLAVIIEDFPDIIISSSEIDICIYSKSPYKGHIGIEFRYYKAPTSYKRVKNLPYRY